MPEAVLGLMLNFLLSATICRHPFYLSVRISTRMLHRILQYTNFQPEVCHVMQHLLRIQYFFLKTALSAVALTVLFASMFHQIKGFFFGNFKCFLLEIALTTWRYIYFAIWANFIFCIPVTQI